MRRAALLVVVLALFAVSCGDDPSPAEQTLSKAADALEDVRRGSLRLKVAAATTAASDREVGFELEGPFELAEKKGALPEVRFAVTDLMGSQMHSATFVSDGRHATVTQQGRTVEVEDADVAHLRGQADPTDGLVRLHVDEWARSPRMEPGGRVVGEVDVVNALNDVLSVAADVGADPRGVDRIEGDDAERLRRSVRGSRIEVLVDDDTDVVRQVRMLLTFGVRTRDDVARVLGRLAGVQLAVEVDLDDVELRRDR